MEMVMVSTMDTAGVDQVLGEAEQLVLPGFRFHPTDQELVGFYLRRKVEKKPIRIDVIKQVDIYKYDPWDLPRVACNDVDKGCYFFCLRGIKYKNSVRPNRVTGSGFWKATGIDRSIYSTAGEDNECIGLKKCLVYYRGSAGKGTKTDWMMHEFRLPPPGRVTAGKDQDTQQTETWTICRVFKRTVDSCKEYLPSRLVPSEHSVVTYSQITESNRSLVTCFEGGIEPYAGPWNPSAQADHPSAITDHPNICSTSNPSEFVWGEGNWDELGKVVEFMLDPSLAHQCT